MSVFVTRPTPHSAPGACVIVPGRRADERGFVDTGTELDGLRGPLHIYLSAEGIRLLAQRHSQLGLVDEATLRASEHRNAALQEQLTAARAEVEQLRASQDRIAGLARDGFIVHKQKGPAPARRS